MEGNNYLDFFKKRFFKIDKFQFHKMKLQVTVIVSATFVSAIG